MDFDRLHSQRLTFHEIEVARREAEAIKNGSNRSIEDQVFTSGEGIKFPIPRQADGPYPGEIIDGVRSNREM